MSNFKITNSIEQIYKPLDEYLKQLSDIFGKVTFEDCTNPAFTDRIGLQGELRLINSSVTFLTSNNQRGSMITSYVKSVIVQKGLLSVHTRNSSYHFKVSEHLKEFKFEIPKDFNDNYEEIIKGLEQSTFTL